MKTSELQNIKIGIVGLGLIGGSLAKAFKSRAKISNIHAVDINEDSLIKAHTEGNIRSYSTDLKSIKECDVVFICVTPEKIKEMLKDISPWYKGLVTEVASAKYKLYKYTKENFPGIRYIPTHPMAGSERVGYDASKENLFENAPFIICTDYDNNNNTFYKNDLKLLDTLAKKILAKPLEMDIKNHDNAVGLISHLPHIIAYSLVNLVSLYADESTKEIAAGGFKDITRIASADPSLWSDIVCQSNEALIVLIDRYLTILENVSANLKNNEKIELEKSFNNAKVYRDNLVGDSKRKNRYVQIWVDVDDRPGMIGQVAVILGDNGINIKNINIQDNREYEGGCMRITLASLEDARRSVDILGKVDIKSRIV